MQPSHDTYLPSPPSARLQLTDAQLDVDSVLSVQARRMAELQVGRVLGGRRGEMRFVWHVA